jgi:hypothetical protein
MKFDTGSSASAGGESVQHTAGHLTQVNLDSAMAAEMRERLRTMREAHRRQHARCSRYHARVSDDGIGALL